jgi:hypothetical protein
MIVYAALLSAFLHVIMYLFSLYLFSLFTIKKRHL